jgi:hypothetical protein
VTHEFPVKVMLSADEYVAFKALCEEDGQSQSGMARSLIKQRIHDYAIKDVAASRAVSTHEKVQD